VAEAAGRAGYAEALQGAREIGAAMKNAVPRNTGKLADSIRLETDAQGGRVWIKAGGSATMTANHTDYALHQEFGTKEMPANPFFYPIWRLYKKSTRSKIDRAMKKAIEAEMSK